MNFNIVSDAILINGLIKNLLRETYHNSEIFSFININEIPSNKITTDTLICLIIDEKSLGNFELAKEFKNSYVFAKILVIDLALNRNLIRDIIQNNIDGYIHGSLNKSELLSVINILLSNKKYYDSASIDDITNKTNFYLSAKLTSREKDIFNYLAKGATNNEIADTIHISESTVKKHVSNILAKLNFKDRRELILRVQNNTLYNI